MLRLRAAESSLTVYSGRFGRTGAAVWRGVPVIAAYDTRRRGDGEICGAAADCAVPPLPTAKRVRVRGGLVPALVPSPGRSGRPLPPGRGKIAGERHAGLGDRVGRARARAVL